MFDDELGEFETSIIDVPDFVPSGWTPPDIEDIRVQILESMR